MPETTQFVHCVRRKHVEHAGESWCGRTISSLEWAFVDTSHAAENGLQEGYPVACMACVEAICAALHVGHDRI